MWLLVYVMGTIGDVSSILLMLLKNSFTDVSTSIKRPLQSEETSWNTFDKSVEPLFLWKARKLLSSSSLLFLGKKDNASTQACNTLYYTLILALLLINN